MYKIGFIILLALTACTSATVNQTNVTTSDSTVTPTASNTTTSINYKDSILGNWTDGSSENATIQVLDDSIYYIEHLDRYKYSVQNDSIKIYFKDTIFTGKMHFKADTLLWITKTDTTKLWKFN